MCLYRSSESCYVDGGVVQLIGPSVEGHNDGQADQYCIFCIESFVLNH